MTISPSQSEADHPRHPLRVVVQRTTLSSHVLRAWERRYGAVAPVRTEGGQRLYSDNDIGRLSLLQSLTSAGGSISQLARLSIDELRRLAHSQPVEAPPVAPADPVARWRGSAMVAIQALDAGALRSELGRAALALGLPAFLDELVAPLLREVGVRWREGRLGIAQEHLVTVVVREVLGWVRDSADTLAAAPQLVVATPANQMHEGGALLVAAAAAGEGWRVTCLGANLPGEDIAAAVVRTGARAVALSVIHPDNDPALGTQLALIRRALPGPTLLIGGAAAPAYRAEAEAVGGLVMTELADLRAALSRLAGAT